MKILLGLNFDFFDESPDKLIKKIKETKNNISGFEIYMNVEKEEKKEYLIRLAKLCNEKKLLLQIHSIINNTSDIKKHVDFYNEISKIYNSTINIVNHSVESNNIYMAQEETNTLFSEILNYIFINKYNLKLSIENLNSVKNKVRLSKDYIMPILYNNQDLYFTYNIGHELMDYGQIVNLKPIFVERLSNVQFYNYDYNSNHKIATTNDDNKLKWVKALNYLKQIGYKNTIVLEYSAFYLGKNFDERITNYIKSAEFIYEYIGGNL